MKNLFTTMIVLSTCFLLLSCKKDDSNPTQNSTSGTVQGIITYSGAGTPSATKLLYVGIYLFSNTNMQGAPNGSTIQVSSSATSPFSYSFAVPPGDYQLGTAFDLNGDGSVNSGNTDPYLIYTPNNSTGTGTFGTAAAKFTVIAGQTFTANVSFGDTYKK